MPEKKTVTRSYGLPILSSCDVVETLSNLLNLSSACCISAYEHGRAW